MKSPIMFILLRLPVYLHCTCSIHIYSFNHVDGEMVYFVYIFVPHIGRDEKSNQHAGVCSESTSDYKSISYQTASYQKQ